MWHGRAAHANTKYMMNNEFWCVSYGGRDYTGTKYTICMPRVVNTKCQLVGRIARNIVVSAQHTHGEMSLQGNYEGKSVCLVYMCKLPSSCSPVRQKE